VNKILHPTDFSENASKALAFAFGLSIKFNAELVILHVTDLPTIMNSSSSATSFAEMEEEKKASVIEQLEKYSTDHLKNIDRHTKIQFKAELNSSTIKGIIKAINETGADLVVVGTKGQSKLKELIMGSTAKGLVAKAHCPVLTIPENVLFKEIKQIIYASDYNEKDIAALKKLADFAKVYNSEISVLHIFSNDPVNDSETSAFQKLLTEQVKYPHLKYDTQVSANVAESLATYLTNSKADLLAMFEKEDSGIVNLLFHRDMVRKFATHTTIPLMSYNIFSV
jgi:nucleotide-binding universal stress UspA family protein